MALRNAGSARKPIIGVWPVGGNRRLQWSTADKKSANCPVLSTCVICATFTTTQDANGNAVLTLSGGGMVTLAGVAANQVGAGFFA